MQLDERERGFSFSKEGPLDMRMDQSAKLTAKDIVNRWSEKDLGEIFRDYGEEPRWRQTARAIVERRKKRPFETTTDLAETVANQAQIPRKKRHPATRVFQALRMCVNRELESIELGIKKAMSHLAPGGRMGVVSFHSLEDRLIKNLFGEASKPLKKIVGEKEEVIMPMMRALTKKPLVPSKREKNPRARSAKLRFIERI